MPATPAWPPRSAPRLFVEPALELGETRRIEGKAAHYLANVMRAKPDDAVILCDNMTGEWAARIDACEKRAVTVTLVDRLRPREAVPDLWLIVAPVKKPHFDLVLEKSTELGVDRIIPVLTRRSVVDKVNDERARAIICEAAEQCSRTALPSLAPMVPLARLLIEWPEERTLFFADELGGENAATAFAEAGGPAGILVGPEGGFDDAERSAIRSNSSTKAITLGPRILRAETAALAAAALWMAAAGDWR